MFEHAWRQTLKKFHDVDMHGVDWDRYREDYARFLPHVTNNWDFAEIVSGLEPGEAVVVSLDRVEVRAGAPAEIESETER